MKIELLTNKREIPPRKKGDKPSFQPQAFTCFLCGKGASGGCLLVDGKGLLCLSCGHSIAGALPKTVKAGALPA